MHGYEWQTFQSFGGVQYLIIFGVLTQFACWRYLSAFLNLTAIEIAWVCTWTVCCLGIKIAKSSSTLACFVSVECCLPAGMENQTVSRSGYVRVLSVPCMLLFSPVCLTFAVDLKRLTCGRTLELLPLLRIAVQCVFMGCALRRLHKP